MMKGIKSFIFLMELILVGFWTSQCIAAPIEVDQIEIEGVSVFNQTEIESSLDIFAGEVLLKSKVVQTAKNLQSLYQSRGYLAVRVRSDLVRRKNPKGKTETILKFTIFEGKPTRMKEIRLVPLDLNNLFLKSDWNNIKKKIESKINFSAGEIMHQDRMSDVRKAISEILVEEEFISSSIKGVKIHPVTEIESELLKKYPDTGGWGIVEIKLSVGDRVKFGFRGNKEFSKAELHDIIDEKREIGFSENFIEEIKKAIIAHYRQSGFAQTEVKVFTFEKFNQQERMISYHITEGPRVEIDKIQFDGNFAFKNDELEKIFYEKASPLLKQGYYVEEEIKRSAASLVEWIQSKGYLSAKMIAVSHYFIKGRTRSVSTIYLYEGDKTIVNMIEIKGLKVMAKNEALKMLGIQSDQPLNLFAFNEGVESIKAAYRSMGYLDIQITNENRDDVIQYYQKNRIADIALNVDEGWKIRVSKIFIEGADHTFPSVIKRELEFNEGDVLTSDSILKSEQNLRRLGIFGSITIQARTDASKPGFKQVRVVVQEGAPGRVGGGIGIRNDLGLRLFTEFAYTNLWGKNHTWSISANANRRFEDFCQTRVDASVCFVEYAAQMGYRWPWFAVDRLTLRSEISFERRRYFQFDALGGALKMNFERSILKKMNLVAGLTYRLERTKQENAVFNEDNQTLTIGAIIPSIQIDLRDNLLAPKKGFFARMSFEFASTAFGSQGSPCPIGYTRFQVRADQFIPLSTWANWYMSFRGGIARNLISDAGAAPGCSVAVPLIKQFTLGGAGSLRGYQLQEVNKQNLSISGTLSFINYRTQIDFPLAGALKIGPFFDAGNLFVDRFGFAPLLMSTGFGIRYITPVGPINLDWGFKLNPQSRNEDRQRIHFSVGIL